MIDDAPGWRARCQLDSAAQPLRLCLVCVCVCVHVRELPAGTRWSDAACCAGEGGRPQLPRRRRVQRQPAAPALLLPHHHLHR
jgi:hypothetical protein